MAKSSVIWVAHRGVSTEAPENTLPAIELAIRRGADACEFDVRATRDGRVVLMHNDTVDKTTDGQGPLRELSLRQLRKLDAGSWKAKKFAGVRVPTLTEALRACKGCIVPVVEIKEVEIAGAVAKALQREGMVGDAVVIAFDDAALRGALEVVPRLTVLWLVGYDRESTPSGRELAHMARARGAVGLDARHDSLTPELVRDIRRRGLTVWTWTVNDTKRAAQLADMGVVGITTDAGRLRI